MRYVEVEGRRLVVHPSARDRLVRGARWAFVAPWVAAALGWGAYGWLADGRSLLAVAVTWTGVAIACAVPSILGLWAMATSASRARLHGVVIDQDEHLIRHPGREPDVFRAPRAVCVARVLGGWSLRLEGERPVVLLRRVPHGSGRALAEAADALAEALEVDARVPDAARRAKGWIPHDPDLWAALAYAPVDGVNVAYAMLALISARSPRLRFAAKQSLALLVVEGLVGLCLAGCLGVPILLVAAPLPLEAVALVCPLALFGIVRVGIRVTAAMRARRGELWVMPWLAPLARRWAPPPR